MVAADPLDVTQTIGSDLARTPRDSGSDPQVSSSLRVYLVVFEGDSSTMFDLPLSGSTTIGRADTCNLRLSDASVSRAHAHILTSNGQAIISDLGSHNGTFVNGELVETPRPLVSGDVIKICGANLIFHSSGRVREQRTVLSFLDLCERMAYEVDRALRYERPLCVLALSLGSRTFDRGRAQSTLLQSLRRMDLAGWDDPDYYIVVAPETDRAQAAALGRRLLQAFSGGAESPRVGVVDCPEHGFDVDSLLTRARAACGAAEPQRMTFAEGTAYETLTFGDKQVLVADPAMQRLYALIGRVAASDLPVLIYGETGAGKDLAARALHSGSKRKDHPLVALNCATVPEPLAESILFGHAKGAFTGANENKSGLIESAAGGTLFLDEIGELPIAIQAKLLRVLETKRAARLGDVQERSIDVRLVAATNRNLKEEVKEGRFRADLFFRLSAASVWLPPLRDRVQEIPILARAFLTEACERNGREAMVIADEAMRMLVTHSWPGNVRELRNVIDYVAATCPGLVLEAEQISDVLGSDAKAPPPRRGTSVRRPPPSERQDVEGAPIELRPIAEEIAELEKDRIRLALERTGGNRTHAANLISMPLRTFARKMKEYGLAD